MASGGASPFPWLVLFYLCRRHAGLEAWQSTSWIAPDKSHLSGRSGRRNEVVVGVVLGCNCWLLPWQWQTKDQEVRSHGMQPLIAAWGHTWEIFQRFIITVSQELKWSMHTNVYLRLCTCVFVCTKVCSNLPGKLIWPKLSNPKILPTSFLMSDNLLLLVPCGFLLFG